jgi:hypothetical protein
MRGLSSNQRVGSTSDVSSRQLATQVVPVVLGGSLAAGPVVARSAKPVPVVVARSAKPAPVVVAAVLVAVPVRTRQSLPATWNWSMPALPRPRRIARRGV